MAQKQFSLPITLLTSAVAVLGLIYIVSDCRGQPKPSDPRIGRPRWMVMTATDPGADGIVRVPVPATIEWLLSQPRPNALSEASPPQASLHKRFAPVETTLWSVEAQVIEVNHTEDGDYHLILRSSSGKTMVAELPDPRRMTHASRFAKDMTDARRYLVSSLQPGEGVKEVNARMRIVGVGYFGRADPLESSARNGVQLHPVISLRLL